jgi:hypothetical protein
MSLGKRQQHVVARLVLAAWLFALFASVVHACGLDENVGQLVLVEAADFGGQHRSTDCASGACEKFCADDLTLLAKVKTAEDPPTGLALAMPTVFGEAFRVAAAPPASRLPSPDPPPGAAINTRFVRLAL